ncbi:hypothetical protein HAHE_19260 [Haloferula helveola]|uniref:Uncharacterized protein n=2 Tax=Haloferula helveola TaxID=490095 RepID=A0ABM7RFU8_9BACT|nr:hypothetical protein HAHE_19260 [Haloferula helveola]
MPVIGGSRAPEESTWNADGVWQRQAGDPPVYVPKGYSGSADESQGSFVTDKRDKKRFFIPSGGAGGISEAVLRNDAYSNSGGRP